jgi:hypothetical protein
VTEQESQATSSTSQRCPIHGIPDCSPLLNGCSWKPVSPSTCSQCGQRTPVCAECGDSIIFVPRAGFGNEGEWQHLAAPKVHIRSHQPRPKVFIT